PERVDDGRGVAAGEALELAVAHAERIADDAALRAAERKGHYRALPRPPRRERGDLFGGDVHVEPDAALGGAARRVVQHAVSGIDLHLATVEPNRARDYDLVLGTAQDLVDPGLEVQALRRVVEARHHRFERILLRQECVLVGT